MDMHDNHPGAPLNDLPGDLAWLPAADHPELLAPAVAAALTQMPDPGGVFVTAIDPELADTAAFCQKYGVRPEESANCVIVEGRRGGDSSLAAVMVLAVDRADVNRAIRTHLGVRKASFAPMDAATSLTGMEYGGITPLGLPGEWPLLIDEAVAAEDWLVIGSGIRGSKLAITGEALASLPGAEVFTLTIG